jgi:hypothetical protein
MEAQRVPAWQEMHLTDHQPRLQLFKLRLC